VIGEGPDRFFGKAHQSSASAAMASLKNVVGQRYIAPQVMFKQVMFNEWSVGKRM